MKSILLVLSSVAPAVAGQLLLKFAIARLAINMDATGPLGYYVKLFTTPLVLLGFFMYGLSSLIWLFILSKLPLSLAYPLVSMGYVMVIFFSWLLLHEHVGVLRIVGVTVICIGVTLLALSAGDKEVHKTGDRDSVAVAAGHVEEGRVVVRGHEGNF